MSFLAATLHKDLVRWWQDRNAFLVWLAIPLLIGGLLTTLTAADSGPTGILLIDDQDDSFVSGQLAGVFAQDQLADLFELKRVSATEGMAIMADGEASGLLSIPSGFQDAVLNDTPMTLTLTTNPSQVILPGIIQNVTEVLLDAGFYLQVLFGDELREIQGLSGNDGPSDQFVASLAVDINAKMQVLGPSLATPALDLDIVEALPGEARPDIALLFVPGIILMALMFTAQGLSADFWAERENGALRRLVSSPGSLFEYVMGKSLAAAVVIVFIAGVTTVLAFAYHGIGWSKLLPSMLFAVTAGVGFFGWFAALQMLFSSRKGASLLSNLLVFPLLMIGGSFFPLDTLPDWLAAIGRRVPNGFVVDKMTVELTAAKAWTFGARSWAIIATMTVSGLALSAWRLQSGFARR